MLRQSGTLMETMSLGSRRAGIPSSFSATSKAWGEGRCRGWGGGARVGVQVGHGVGEGGGAGAGVGKVQEWVQKQPQEEEDEEAGLGLVPLSLGPASLSGMKGPGLWAPLSSGPTW